MELFVYRSRSKIVVTIQNAKKWHFLLGSVFLPFSALNVEVRTFPYVDSN